MVADLAHTSSVLLLPKCYNQLVPNIMGSYAALTLPGFCLCRGWQKLVASAQTRAWSRLLPDPIQEVCRARAT